MAMAQMSVVVSNSPSVATQLSSVPANFTSALEDYGVAKTFVIFALEKLLRVISGNLVA